MTRVLLVFASALVVLATAPGALAARGSWAAPEIRAVTKVGVLGRSPATFRPQAPLTQSALAGAIGATNAIQHPPLPPAPAPTPAVEVDSTLAAGSTVGGVVPWQVDAPGRNVASIDFAVDGTGLFTAGAVPFAFDLGAGGLDTTKLADGQHQLAVNAHFVGGGYAIAVWTITVDNADGGGNPYGAGELTSVPVVKSWMPAPPAVTRTSHAVLYKAASPARAVTIKELDAALVSYLGLGGAAYELQTKLSAAGLTPPPHTGTEAIARLLGLRLDHPASEDDLELLPNMAATRAEAAWSFAHVLHLDEWATQYAQQAADNLSLPQYSLWQRRILTTAMHYVGYPYVWGGTSPTREVDFGVPAVGGFDCSGFVWRLYKLTPYPGERDLSSVLRGRTTYQMSGEVPHRELIPIGKLQPADVMFFGDKGRRSSPSVVDHTAIYLGADWLIQSSGQGVTLLPFDGWYRQSFAWARRPLREAGLVD